MRSVYGPTGGILRSRSFDGGALLCVVVAVAGVCGDVDGCVILCVVAAASACRVVDVVVIVVV